MIVGTVLLLIWPVGVRALWPSLVALTLVFLTRRALLGLLVGAGVGALLLAEGNPWQATISLASDHLAPHFASQWKLAAIAFTLILGGFAGVIERSGALEGVVNGALKRARDPARGLQGGVLGLGLVCFFDGLANSLLVGRLSRHFAPKCGVSPVKLAYLTDSTSSTVACVAFVSTWIAYQLSMIRDGFGLLGQEVNPYLYFVRSIPYNAYCWLTLLLVVLVIWRRYHPGPMASYEDEVRRNAEDGRRQAEASQTGQTPTALWRGIVPLVVLLVTLFLGFYGFGLNWDTEPGGATLSLLPVTAEKIALSFGSNAGPFVMILAAVVATVIALSVYPKGRGSALAAFLSGVKNMVAPVFILIAAWMLGSTLSALGAGDLLSRLASENVPVFLLPLLIFVCGALISFSTGTSWGTMGILMPLAIPMVAGYSGLDPVTQQAIYSAVIGAVFSGAVFGDHCSPISDTTIVSSIACGVEPADHVRTQMPYALLAAGVAALAGFLPAGLGVPGWLGLLLGALVLTSFVLWRTRRVPRLSD